MYRSSLSLVLGLALIALPQTGPARAADKLSKVTFDTVDGVTLQGTFYPSPKGKDEPTVLMLHKIGSDSHKDGWDSLATKLQDKGYSVLSFDFRGHGNSTSVDSTKFWDRRFYPWNAMYIKGGSLDAKGKPKDSISKEGFLPGYYPYLVNDIAAAKAFLDERNDAGECNSRALLLIGAEDGGALGALWMHSEWNRFAAAQAINNPMGPRFPPLIRGVEKDSEGKGQYCALWLTMSTSLAGKMSVSTSVKTALREAGRDKKVPMGFLYGEKDETAQNHAKDYIHLIKGDTTAADDKLKFTLEHPVKGTKLTGSGLLRKDLDTEDMILTYLDRLSKKNVPHKWSKVEASGQAYVWAIGTNALGPVYRIAKEEKAKMIEPIPLVLLGITP